ncbi:methylated-DNA--[protein]-cysteine S-methyltransferase [Tellurirhabdus bombi]|uniref:methylated-DNA--[protein]-cysteine S-methyltransferase n=1 Tax=Tellurirhabdus bombi TaxID=2907205 RepID=UPI00286D9F29|nr:methylated-DNA--[protein]-cysteine S-methyltransferase [Tellurirhabdus bombi]
MSETYQQIARAIDYLNHNFRQQPKLAEVAEQAYLSEYHFQRLFTDWAGVSPKKFLQYLTLDYAKGQLRKGLTLAETADASGLSGTSRLHDLFVTLEGVTPGQFKLAGEGLLLRYGIFDGPFGLYFLAALDEKICKLWFLDESEPVENLVQRLKAEWPGAKIQPDQIALETLARRIFVSGNSEQLRLLVKGSFFQLKVWEALLRIPEGRITSYDQIATAIGMPNASRAVGTAIGNNPIGYLIPCHRVIKKTGLFGNYRWGAVRKTALLGWEAAQTAKTEAY